MKTKLYLAATLVLLALSSALTRADVIFQDSFSYPDGVLTNVSSGLWFNHSGTTSVTASNGQAHILSSRSEDVSANLTNAPYASSTNVAALYAKVTVNLDSLPTAGGAYFFHFKDAGAGTAFRARVYANTTGAAAGTYRLGLANAGSLSTNIQTDLALNTTNTIVIRYVLATGIATLWLAPSSETSPGVTATDAPNIATAMSCISFRQATGEGSIFADDLVVGTQFADVVPSSAGSNPPFITVQPVGGSTSVSNSFTFSTVAGGDAPSYQWFKSPNPITDATNRTHVIGITETNDTGSYFVVVSNLTGISVTSSVVNLTVAEAAVAPNITTNPVSQTVIYGSSATFSVTATGTDPLFYQWKFNGTNVGANAAFYTVNNAFTNHAGPYEVIITNVAGSATSSVATLTVTAPPLTNIAYLHTLINTNYEATNTSTLYTVEGTVTTWQNLTPPTNALFYIQDATAGMAVFWGGNVSSGLPAAGDLVRVTAPLANFNGVLELGPVGTNVMHSVTVLSTNNPLPTAYEVPFDPGTNANPGIMETLEGRYMVASNVFIELTTPTFSGTCLITNSIGETITLYANANTDIQGQTKPTGPVTIYGVLGQYDTSNPKDTGYQLIPSRYADILSAAKGATVRFTNVLANLVRPNGQLTNTFSENVLRPGESVTMKVNVTDPDGGTVTIASVPSGLPGSASWTVSVPTGTDATATFTFQPVSGDAGVNYTASLSAATTNVTTTNSWTFYVPTPAEQNVFISEILANPTSDTNSPFFNPLHRVDVPSSSVTTYDEYIEVVNLSDTSLDLLGWTVADAVSIRHRFYSGAPSESLASSNAIVIYGGPLSANFPSLPVLSFPASESSAGLALNNTGSETITLRNSNTNIIDRLVYTAADLSTNGSITRFPSIYSWFVPQSLVGTNGTSAGLQYNGATWDQALASPTGVSNIVVTAGNPVTLSFTADTSKAYTLWKSDVVTGPFTILAGQQFPTTSGLFSISNPPSPTQFYFITAQ